MKIRDGFVSNSSSSSFIVKRDFYDGVDISFSLKDFTCDEVVDSIKRNIDGFYKLSDKEQYDLLFRKAMSMYYYMFYYFEDSLKSDNSSFYCCDDKLLNAKQYYKRFFENDPYAFTEEDKKKLKEISKKDEDKKYDLLDELVSEKAKVVAEEWAKNNYAAIEYSDNAGEFETLMEHYVMPDYKKSGCVIASVSEY